MSDTRVTKVQVEVPVDPAEGTARVLQQHAIVVHDAPDATARVYQQWIIYIVKNRRARPFPQVVG